MQIRQRQLGSVICLDVVGRLVIGVKDGLLKDTVNGLLCQGHRNIVINLKEVCQIDTCGLAAIIALRSAVEAHNGTVMLLNLPRRVYDLLVITKLITVFEVLETEAEAVRRFSERANA